MTWQSANQNHLMAALADIKSRLRHHVALIGSEGNNVSPHTEESARFDEGSKADSVGISISNPNDTSALDTQPAALDALCVSFGLSRFERDLLLLCAGVELDSTVASLCAAAQGDPSRNYPTFSLSLAALPDAHWSATDAGCTVAPTGG